MNSRNIVAIKNENTCMCCLKEKTDLTTIIIPEMGYGSAFDGESTKLHLCRSCYQHSNPKIWSLEIITEADEDGDILSEEYIHEKEIIDYIENLPIQSKELIWNRYNEGFNADHKMKPQDWIDYYLNELTYEKCKEYGIVRMKK